MVRFDASVFFLAIKPKISLIQYLLVDNVIFHPTISPAGSCTCPWLIRWVSCTVFVCFGEAIQVRKSGTFRAKLFSRGFWKNVVYFLM